MVKEELEVERNKLICKWIVLWIFKNMILLGLIFRLIKSLFLGFVYRCYNFCSYVVILM